MATHRMDVAALVGKLLEEEDIDLLREGVRVLAQALMDAEVSSQIGAGLYERSAARTAHRNGYRSRTWDTRVGDDGGIWIQYALSDTWIGRGWVITQVDYAVGDELSDIPVTKYLAPKICQFTHHTFSPGVTTTPVYAGLFDTTGAAVDDVVIAARAIVYNRPTGATKCLWSAGLPFGGNSWATYSVYVIE